MDTLRSEVSPVVRDVEVKVADVRCVFREDDVTGELARREPEGKVRDVVELELCMNPAEENRFWFSFKAPSAKRVLYSLLFHRLNPSLTAALC